MPRRMRPSSFPRLLLILALFFGAVVFTTQSQFAPLAYVGAFLFLGVVVVLLLPRR